MILDDFVEVSHMDMRAVNKIVELSHTIDGSGYIHTSRDWDFVEILWKFWKTGQSKHYSAFMREMKGYREGYKDNVFGVAKGKGGAEIRHVGNMPESFMRLLENYFPKQEFNYEFYRKLGSKIGDFNLGAKS